MSVRALLATAVVAISVATGASAATINITGDLGKGWIAATTSPKPIFTITVPTGKTYEVSFATGAGPAKKLKLTISGVDSPFTTNAATDNYDQSWVNNLGPAASTYAPDWSLNSGWHYQLLTYAGTSTFSVSDFKGSSPIAFGFRVDAVPEPATWAMMLIGFGGLGAALRMNRRRTAMATA